MRVTNPAGTITPDAWRVVSEAFKSKERVRVEVRGEEDLLALVCIALAPSSAAVLYGLPTQGVVVVRADDAAKSRVLDVLRRMDRGRLDSKWSRGRSTYSSRGPRSRSKRFTRPKRTRPGT